jgi:hypothetical protein
MVHTNGRTPIRVWTFRASLALCNEVLDLAGLLLALLTISVINLTENLP